MSLYTDYNKFRHVEDLIINFVNNGGHFVLISDDRLFINLFRKTLTTQLELPATSVTVAMGEGRILRTVKEMSVKKKRLVVLMEAVFNHERMDETFKQMHRRIKNANFTILTTETELPRLALLREEGLAESWITKPVDINTLLLKIAYQIKPPGQVEELIKKAEQCLGSEAYRMALGLCRRIFEAQPNSPAGYMIMGDAYRGLDKVEDMVDAYEQANDLDEMFLSPLKKLEQYFKDRGQPERRLEFIERLDTISPLNIERKVEIGGIHLDIGQDSDAREMFEEAFRVAGKEELADLGDVSEMIGDAYAERNREEAEEYYRRAVAIHGPRKEDMPLYNSLGITLRKQGRWDAAIEEYKKAIQVVPDDEVLYYNLALAYVDGGMYENAILCVERAQKISPDFHANSTAISYNIADIYINANKPDIARAYLEKCLEIDPDYIMASSALKNL